MRVYRLDICRLLPRILFCLFFTVVGSHLLQGQTSNVTSLQLTAIGTGRTTGNIANITVHNPTDHLIAGNIGPYFIPSDGKYQPYIVPDKIPVHVPPKGHITLPVEGYCADIHRPPVPSGSPMPEVTKWITPGSLSENWMPTTATGWNKVKHQNIFIPGKWTSLDHTINIDRHPEEAAGILLKAIRLIRTTYDDLVDENRINTPFSGNPEKEREAVIQQTFWIFAAELQGEPYTKEDFTTRTYDQFETNTNRPVPTLSEKDKENLETGITTFWETFQAVGAEAKVLKVEDANPDILIQAQNSEPCRCDSLLVNIDVFDGNTKVDSITVRLDKFSSSSEKVELDSRKVKSGDSLEIRISSIQIVCSCDLGANCPHYPRKSIGGPDETKPGKVLIETGENDADAMDDNLHCQRLSREGMGWNEDKSEYRMKLGFSRFGRRDDAPYQSFTIKAICKSGDCSQKLCKQKILMRFFWAQ